jgi:hypothetical protein
MGKDIWEKLSKPSRGGIDRYFLEERCPYTKRRAIKTKVLVWCGGICIFGFVFVVLLFGDPGEKQTATAAASPDYSTQAHQVSPINASTAVGAAGSGGSTPGSFAGGSAGVSSSVGFASGLGAGNMSARNRSANQVIRRGVHGNDPGSQLPMGFGLPAKLLNAVLSTDSATPVIAEITDDVLALGILSIPAQTRAIGNASYDDASRRIQLRFHTLVYPEGDQHPIQGLGMMLDGSAGLAGEYHSGETKRQLGRFLGNFIGGLADGMKDRQAQGQSGIPMEPGSIKNGILNGVALSGVDQARVFSEDLERAKPAMSLQSGQSFVIFLEKEYIP